MVGHFIASTRKGDFRSLVFQGIQVSTCHAQLRSLLNEQLGAEYARLFAEPLKDAQKDIIDWYVPTAYSPESAVTAPMPLSALTSEAQLQIKMRLQKMLDTIGQTANTLVADTDSSRHLSGTLLQMATLFPDDSHIYVVGNDIVLTCWGMTASSFEENTETVVRNGLVAAPIPMPGMPLAATTAGTAATVITRSKWWRFLLFLLLALLLLFLLAGGVHSCMPKGALPFGLGGCTRHALPLSNATMEKSVPDIPAIDLPDLPPLRAEVEALKRKAQQRALLCPTKQDESLGIPPAVPLDLGDLLAVEPEKDTPKTLEPKPAPTKEESPQKKPSTPPKQGEAMKLPPKGEKSMDFLKGCWNCETGLSDLQNNPIQVEFCFNDSGHGNVTIIDKRRQTYRGSARAQNQGNRLTIDTDRAQLPKGNKSFSGLEVECTPDQQGNAMCLGKNKDYPTPWKARFTRK